MLLNKEISQNLYSISDINFYIVSLNNCKNFSVQHVIMAGIAYKQFA